MWNSHRVLSIIPARGGSRRLPGKNLRPLGGKPLIEWSIELSRALDFIDETVVSSDDPAILDLALRAGAEAAERPPELATDTATTMSAVFHVLGKQETPPDIVILLQPTSPLRWPEDVLGTLRCLADRKAEGAVSVSKTIKHPEWAYRLREDGRLTSLPEKCDDRDSSRIVGINGAVYAVYTDWLLEHQSFVADGVAGYLMPPERSVDIDLLEDFEEAERLLAANNPQPFCGNK